MQEFAVRSNIERFKRLIATTTDADQLTTLKNLLELEEERLCILPRNDGRRLPTPNFNRPGTKAKT
jgi:hypothetical protein